MDEQKLEKLTEYLIKEGLILMTEEVLRKCIEFVVEDNQKTDAYEMFSLVSKKFKISIPNSQRITSVCRQYLQNKVL